MDTLPTCQSAGCDAAAHRSGLCANHYRERRAANMRAYAPGNPEGPRCDVEGCERRMYGLTGLCGMHYQRRRTTGVVGPAAQLFMLGASVRERFEAKVNRDGAIPEYRPELGPCWEWRGSRSRGYGMMRADGTMRGAHCIAYELFVGSIPDNPVEPEKKLELDHLCRVRQCVNPAHLEPVTSLENFRRGFAPGAVAQRSGVCKHGHDQTAPGARVWKGDRWRCRACQSRWRHERYVRLGK